MTLRLFANNKLINFLLVGLIIAGLIYRISIYWDNYLLPYDYQYWESKYLNSQWIIPGSKNLLGDDGLFAYAGYEYLKGLNPILINSETPPFGKYLIGLSINLFNNQNIFALLCGLICLILLNLLSQAITSSKTLSLFIVFIFSLEPLFYTQFSAPYLDLLYLSLLILYLFFLYRQKIFWAMVFLGLMAGTKNTFFTLSLGVFIYFLYILPPFLVNLLKNSNHRKHNFSLIYPLIKLICAPVIAFLLVLLTYYRYFQLGNSLYDFFGVQKYIFYFYANGAKASFGVIISMLLYGNWPTWWGSLEKIKEWTLFWPISFISALIIFPILLISKKINNLKLIFIWSFSYLAYLLFIPVWPRYILLLLPFLYLIFFAFLNKCYREIFR